MDRTKEEQSRSGAEKRVFLRLEHAEWTERAKEKGRDSDTPEEADKISANMSSAIS